MLALAACAGPQAVTPRELAELRAELRAMRDSNARLERRLERLETEGAVANARRVASPEKSVASAQTASRELDERSEVPELAVVKLKPKTTPAPKLDTRVAIVEPAPEVIEELAELAEVRASRSSGGGGAGGTSSEGELDPEVLEAQYEAGVSSLKTGNLEGGVTRLKQFAEDNRRHARADNALFFSAIGLIGLDNHEEAAKTLELLLQRYPAGDAVTEAMFKLAECRLRLNQMKSARELFAKLVAQYPGTPAAEQAEQRLASLASNES